MKMNIRSELIAVMFLFFPVSLHQTNRPSRLHLWDVGQGQWVTEVSEKHCAHYDVGGERFPNSVIELCSRKVNTLSLSHWDYDHISMIFKARRRGLSFCISHLPQGRHHFRAILETWPRCETDHAIPSNIKSQNRNDLSSVFKLDEVKTLVTGDAPKKRERQLTKIMNLTTFNFLIVGHHGSHTSSDLEFLKRLTNLKMGLVSARLSKYGHPHPVVVARFRKLKIPLVSTEDWGNLIVNIEE